jgi:CubicO group peptidase (beta-lactamase class C family)
MSQAHEEKWAQLSEYVAQLIKEKNVPGLAVGIWHQGRQSMAGFGVTNVDHPLPVTAETLFQIGSITKTFTGTLIMRLVERGDLDLDAPVRSYLPDFKVLDETASSQATIRHLLTHMGGWVGDFFHDTGVGDDALNKYIDVMADLEQLAPLGTVWSYNNAGFSVAGGIIEAVTGTSYQAALKELLLQPLGLQTAYLDAGEVMTHRFVVGHRTSDDGVSVARPWPLPRSIYPVGGLICHVPDLLRYARFHLGDGVAEDGTRLLSAEAMTQMQTPQVTVWGRERWGLTWAVEDIGEVRQVSHSGGTVGQVTLLLLIPEHNFAIAVLTNANWGGAVTRQISRRALQQFLVLQRDFGFMVFSQTPFTMRAISSLMATVIIIDNFNGSSYVHFRLSQNGL